MMQEIRMTTELLNNESHRKYQEAKQKNLCHICCQLEIHKKFFADCQHLWCCRKCGEKEMLRQMKQNVMPVCPQAECGSPMRTHEESLYSYFSNQSKAIFQQHLKIIRMSGSTNPGEGTSIKTSGGIRLLRCKYPKCSGIIQNNRCKKCRGQICQHCKKITHPPNQPCPQDIQIQGAKKCPSCHQYYVRQGGCHHITCLQCTYQFCEICKKPWDTSHHACILLVRTKRGGCFGEACNLI